MSNQIDENKTAQQQTPLQYCQPIPPQYQVADDEIDLLEYWNVIWSGRWFIIGFTGVCTLMAVLVSLFVLPVTYKSTTVLQPVAADKSTMSQFGALAGGVTSMLGISLGESSNQQLIDFLNSRTLKERLIEKYDLLPKFYPEIWDAEKKAWTITDPEDVPTIVKAIQDNVLKNIFSVGTDKKSELISLSWVDEDPKFAASMLEHTVQELDNYLENEYETDAQRQRAFVEGQLVKAKEELGHWEQQIPSPKQTQAEIQRELTASQLVYQELRKQLELAKIQEAKDVVSFKVLDAPFVPEKKHSPKRAQICAATLVVSSFFSLLLFFIYRAVKSSKNLAGTDE